MKYKVSVYIANRFDVEVEANSEQQARKLAEEQVSLDSSTPTYTEINSEVTILVKKVGE